MMILFEEFVLVFLVLIFLILVFVKWMHTYWRRKNVPQIDPPWIFGNMENLLNLKFGHLYDARNAYEELKRLGHKHGGIYFMKEPIYIPVDIDLIKNILTKDFAHFVDRGFVVNEKKDPLLGHLFHLEGDKWRNMRVKFTPTFTSAKMKMMFKTLLNCGVPMIEHITEVSNTGDALDIKEIIACYMTDVIGSCAFGLECNSFKNPNAEFRAYGRRLSAPSPTNIIQQIIGFCVLALYEYLPIKLVAMDVEKFFLKTVKHILDYRKENNIIRNDFIHLILEMQQNAEASGTRGLTLEEIAAQVFVFFIGGFETSSTAIAFCLHELAFNQDIQDRLREEVRESLKKNNGMLTYDGVMEMKYMDQVVNETLRKYPPIPIINRVCSLDYKIPDTDITLSKGTKVFISSFGLHRDEEYYPDSEKFDPERFTEENKAKRPAFSFLPFGEGPRNCIGLRFGLMQTKTGLFMILNNFIILPDKNEKYDIEHERGTFILMKKGKLMLTIEKLKS